MTTLNLNLDEEQFRTILGLINDEVENLNMKLEKALKDKYCSYDTLDDLARTRNGLYYLSKLLEKKINEHK